MNINMKLITKYMLWMLGCSIATMLINPLTIIAGRVGRFIYAEEPVFVLYYILSYVVVGSLVWYMSRKKKWKIQTLLIWLIANLVLLSFLTCWIYNIKDGLTGLMILTSFIVDSLLSAIPIGFCCYRLHAETHEETHDI